MKPNRVVSQDEWTKARVELLKKEKELMRKQEDLARERRGLPWVKITKDYVFKSSKGTERLSDL